MADTSFITVPSTTDPFPVTVPVPAPEPSPTASGAVSDSAIREEEEPYTIKCICAFTDDDGNTVFCERCETWQHIECYYHDRGVPDVHNCVDCEPRPLDARQARERQIRLREQGENDGDRRVKQRAGSAKKEKKKAGSVKDTPDPPNGFHHHRSESSVSRDQSKKAKFNHQHRSSASVVSLQGGVSLPPDGRKRGSLSNRPQSPVKSAANSMPLYSNEFLHLYDHDQGHADMDSNLFASLLLPAELASWVKDPAALSRVAPGRPAREIFTWSDAAALDRSNWPSLSTETVSDSNVEIDGLHPTWKVLKTHDSVHKDDIVGEVKGKIGLLRDYCLDPGNRWQELRHPEPFVFFHPQLPIYIDSRQEGSQLRYVRRSCRPNVTMKTFITNDVEYHFCFVAKEDISAGSEITAMWYLDPQLFESANGVVKQESSDTSVQDSAAICLSNVLAHFGGCACASEPPHNCLLSSIDRRRHRKYVDSKQASARRKKVRSKSAALSPPVGAGGGGGGRSGNSRAGSEGMKNVEFDDQAESRSASGSARARSRDVTPALTTPSELVFGGSELSAREKRKIAAAEKKFQQLEQDQQASERKRKRGSGQSAHSTPAVVGGQTSYFAIHHGKQADSGSPLSPTSSGPAQRAAYRKSSGSSRPSSSKYVDTSMQTEPDENHAHFVPPPRPLGTNRPAFACRTQLLLKRYTEDRRRFEEQQQQQLKQQSLLISASYDGGKEDVQMKDAEDMSPRTELPREIDVDKAKPPVPTPWLSSAAHNSRIPLRQDLHMPLPPRIFPPLASPSAVSPGMIVTPTTTQSPAATTLDPLASVPSAAPNAIIANANAPAPSPVKKKLSLGDYLIRKGTMATTPTSEKPPNAPTSQQSPMANNNNPNEGEVNNKAGKVDDNNSSSADGPVNVAATSASVSS